MSGEANTSKPKRDWLSKDDWETFSRLFERVEGTNYYDVRELALMLIKNPKLDFALRRDGAPLSTILMLVGKD